jgi:hypothetical protein
MIFLYLGYCILHNCVENEVFDALAVLKLLIVSCIQNPRDRLAVEPQFLQQRVFFDHSTSLLSVQQVHQVQEVLRSGAFTVVDK